MKRILLTGISPESTEESLRTAIEPHFGPIDRVEIVRDGDAGNPMAILDMPLSDQQAFRMVQRITDIWHDGRRVNARLLLHS